MTYWRMQLHPTDPGQSVKHASDSLSAGFIGLDFPTEVGDLMETNQDALPAGQKDYMLFAREMAVGDVVLIMAHSYPFALVTVSSDYNYIRSHEPEIGVWFRHFRRIDREATRYYADLVTDARTWDRITMTDAISPLRDPQSRSYRLIEQWLGAVRPVGTP